MWVLLLVCSVAIPRARGKGGLGANMQALVVSLLCSCYGLSSVAIPKTTSQERLGENLGALSFKLAEEEMRALDGMGCDHHFCWSSEKVT